MSKQNSLPWSHYYLPSDTAVVVEKQVGRCKNLALLLDKYIKRAVIDDMSERREWLQWCIQGESFDSELARSAYARWLSMMKSLNVTLFDLALAWRMVVGLGGETVLETDITLHHLYGIPIISGSALKGLARAYVTGEEKAYFVPEDKPEFERKPSREEKTDHPDILRIFGTQERAGSVLFFDALPLEGKASFIVDIMNPHYPDYYNSLKSSTITTPTNNQSPRPITFLTVRETTFTFALAPRDIHDARHSKDVELVQGWLQKALSKYGVGGKTSAGYGYFNLPPQQGATTVQPELEQSATAPYIRPNIPKFTEGQGISGSVIVPTDDLRGRAPEAKAFLQYREFSAKDVMIIVEAEEAKDWAALYPLG